ncbi:glycosyltransferase [Alphaproteobacteria bacterium]|nr:glycosyltransferase [Alphaproteobacteria bacterium]
MQKKELPRMPLVSVIINCYNGASYLKKAIDSVYAQSYENWEIIFWDNASTDDSKKIAQSYDERLKYYKSEENTPLGEARNFALSKANGKYIAFLDCDDLYLPQKLQLQVELLENSNFAMTYSGAITIDDKGRELRRILAKNVSGYVFSDLLFHYEINMQSVMLRKTILDKKTFSFNTSLRFCPDYNLFMRIAAEYNIGIVEDPLVMYRISSNSLSKQTVDIASNEMKFTLDEIFSEFPGLKLKYKKAVKAAYSKLDYYDAVSFIHKSNFFQARVNLKKVLFQRWEYLALYLILFLPCPKSLILRALNR